MIEMLAVLLAASAPTATVSPPAPAQLALADMAEPDPKKMSQAEIRAHNAKLPREHPYYIRCVRTAEIGSLVKRSFSCRTNQQWTAAEEAGNREAWDISERMSSKAWPTN